MGRWSHCLFGADTDIEHTAVLGKDIFQGNDAGVTWLLAQVLLIAPLDVQAFYVQEYKLDQALASITFATVRQKLDGGLGDKLFQKYRGFEQNDESSFFPDESKYRVIMLGVLTIMVGAKIKAEDLQHLRDLVPTVQCHEGFAFPIAGDNCFRGPGKRQFLAALDHYEAGIPRNFLHSCCHACGKTAVDVGHGLAKCCGCQNYISAAYFCDKDCQKKLWKTHKRGNCGPPRGSGVGIYKAYPKKGGVYTCLFRGAQV